MKRKQETEIEHIKNIKKNKKDTTLADNFGKVYANAIYHASASRSFNDDSGCYYDVLKTEVEKLGDWTTVYQPTKGMKEYEDGLFYYIFKYKEPITEEQFKSFKPMVNKINRLYLESYNDVLKETGNKWTLHTTKGTFEEVAQVVKKLYLDKGAIKIGMTIRGYENWTCNDYWKPLRLVCWLEDIEYSQQIKEDHDKKELEEKGKEEMEEDKKRYKYDAVPY